MAKSAMGTRCVPTKKDAHDSKKSDATPRTGDFNPEADVKTMQAWAMYHDQTLLAQGTLYLVATPIGNLRDITLRALHVLKNCDVIAAEDTRRTGLLLKHFGITKPLLSFYKFNEAKRSLQLLELLRAGKTVALVTDAGTPGISDPGQRVVRAVVAAGLRVEPVPGPCAFIAALTASGLPTDEVHFVGFIPHKSGQRRAKLESLRSVPGTLVLYESPHRLEKLLRELCEVFPDRQVVLARELTKKFEEFVRGTPAELLKKAAERKLKGEFVIVISPGETSKAAGAIAHSDKCSDCDGA